MSRLLRSPAAWVAALALVLALLLSGMRGIWDPDEGRYTNVALHMLDSGDWVSPHRSETTGHWTKPPLTYWAIASSIAVFGPSPWAARLPASLAYLLCVWLAWRIARRLAPGSQTQAAAIYATMLFAFGAAHLITTDYVLAACETLAMWGFVEARFGDGRHVRRWLAVLWAGFGLAFLTKGPPGLLPLLAVFAFDIATPATQAPAQDASIGDGAAMPVAGPRRVRALQWWGPLLLAAIALPWYAVVTARTPGLLQYFLGDEVVNRIASDEFGRHGEWYGWLQIYLPTLLIGTLPWTPALWRWLRTLPARLRGWRRAQARNDDRAGLLLALWVLLPLLVFCLSRSRLPLYILPLFVPLAVIAARQRQCEGRGLPRWRWLLAWAVVLLGLQFAASLWPTHKDASAWAREIRARAPGAISKVEFVEDMARYGLHLHLGADVEKLSLDDAPRKPFDPEYDRSLAAAIADDDDPDAIWITKQAFFDATRAQLQALGYDTVVQGAPYEGRVIFRVRRQAPTP